MSKYFPCTQTHPNKATQFLVAPNPKNTRTTNHITASGEMKLPFNCLDIVAENGGRGHTEVTVCMYGQHTQESMDEPSMVAIPAHGGITRKNGVFPVPVRACEKNGFAGRVRPSRPASACSFSTLRLNLVLTRGVPSAFNEGVHIYTVNRYWVSPKFIGSRYCMPMAFTAKSPLAQCL